MNRGMALERSRIVTPVAVAVEGKDYLYTLLGQVKDDPELQDVQLWDFQRDETGGLERWLELFTTLDGFEERTRAIGVIRDAEDDAESMIRRTTRAFANIGLTAPEEPMRLAGSKPSVGFLVMPHNTRSGCLEHAMLEAAPTDLPTACAEAYLACVDRGERNENWRAKVKVHALIAAGSNPAWTLSQSVTGGLWDFTRPSLKIMRDFMHLLCQV